MKTIQAFQNLDWFYDVGNSFEIIGEELVQVANWQKAIASCSDQIWESIGLKISNGLTKHISSVCKPEFQKWNVVVDSAKCELEESFRRLQSKLDAEGLPNVVADCVKWDAVHILAHEYYAAWNPPTIYERLRDIYLCGHFPCGWVGTWPVGKLRVF